MNTQSVSPSVIRAFELRAGDAIGAPGGYVLTYVGPVEDGLIRATYRENGRDRIRFFAYDEYVVVAR